MKLHELATQVDRPTPPPVELDPEAMVLSHYSDVDWLPDVFSLGGGLDP